MMEIKKLIAEFLGFDILSNNHFNYEGELMTSLPEFESDWNWLMKIVEKIESLPSSELKQDAFVFQIGELYATDVNVYEIKYRKASVNCAAGPYMDRVVASDGCSGYPNWTFYNNSGSHYWLSVY
jgi:hypothetical protein